MGSPSPQSIYTFGETHRAESAAVLDQNQVAAGETRAWRYRELAGDRSAEDGETPWLVLLPSVVASQSGDPVEHVDFVRDEQAHIMIRGLRAISDFEYELQMAQMNHELRPEIETVFLVPEVDYSFLSSSLVREVASLGGDVSRFVSAPVLARLKEHFGA